LNTDTREYHNMTRSCMSRPHHGPYEVRFQEMKFSGSPAVVSVSYPPRISGQGGQWIVVRCCWRGPRASRRFSRKRRKHSWNQKSVTFNSEMTDETQAPPKSEVPLKATLHYYFRQKSQDSLDSFLNLDKKGKGKNQKKKKRKQPEESATKDKKKDTKGEKEEVDLTGEDISISGKKASPMKQKKIQQFLGVEEKKSDAGPPPADNGSKDDAAGESPSKKHKGE
jgi:hypothetical protein